MGCFVEVVIPGRQPQAGLIYLQSKRNIVLTFDFPFTLRVNTQTAFCFHSCGSGGQEQAPGCPNPAPGLSAAAP